jgi:CHAT domain-containing protein
MPSLRLNRSVLARIFRLLKRSWTWLGLSGLTALLCIGAGMITSVPAAPAVQVQSQTQTPAQVHSETLLQESHRLYEAGQFAEAGQALTLVMHEAEAQKNLLQLAIATSNLSLIEQAQGHWELAKRLIERSLTALESSPQSSERQQILAQTQDIEGQRQFALGQSVKALSIWEQTELLYRQLGDRTHQTRVQLSQAEALRRLGFYRRALTQLTDLNQTLQTQPDSLEKAAALRSLGDTLWLSGDLNQAQAPLTQSLAMALRLNSTRDTSTEIAQIHLSLGNLEREQRHFPTALQLFEQAAETANPLLRVQAQLNQLNLLIQTSPARSSALLAAQLDSAIQVLPISRTSIDARLNLATALLKLRFYTEAKPVILAAVEQAQQIQDVQAQSYAVGLKGALYEKTQQYAAAQSATQQALVLAQSASADEILYRWQWQMGRLYREQRQTDAAIETLQRLRSDLAALNRNAQFSFRDSIEPVYRQAVDLLLSEPTQNHLRQARSTLEALQLAELDNFFRRACLNASVTLDQVVDRQTPTAAVLYAITAADHLDVILKLPQRNDLLYHSVKLTAGEFQQILLSFRQSLVDPSRVREMQGFSEQLYRWLIAPAEAALQQSKVDTLVFVLDGELRNVPMAALYDGNRYLIEKYAVALNPGLQLATPKSLSNAPIKAVAAGLSDPPKPFQDFAPLPGIRAELASLPQAGVQTHTLLNQSFTRNGLAQQMTENLPNVVHLATHGKFSSRLEDTYLLAYDGRIGVDQLGELLRAQQAPANSISLLVLSACETAAGDSRAALGLAGVAIQSGARSTLASLWSIDDESTAFFIKTFYTALRQPNATKAKALQQAQIALMQKIPDSPALWSPYVLVGDWL